MLNRLKLNQHWTAHELVIIGVFSAAAKISTLLIALLGGGMNPLSLIIKNLLMAVFMVVVLYKVRKPGTLFLFVLINILVSTLLLGGTAMLVPGLCLAAAIAELFTWSAGGLKKVWVLLASVAIYDFFGKIFSIGIFWLLMRENLPFVTMVTIVVGSGYLGSLAGIFTGTRVVKELRHAGIIRN